MALNQCLKISDHPKSWLLLEHILHFAYCGLVNQEMVFFPLVFLHTFLPRKQEDRVLASMRPHLSNAEFLERLDFAPIPCLGGY